MSRDAESLGRALTRLSHADRKLSKGDITWIIQELRHHINSEYTQEEFLKDTRSDLFDDAFAALRFFHPVHSQSVGPELESELRTCASDEYAWLYQSWLINCMLRMRYFSPGVNEAMTYYLQNKSSVVRHDALKYVGSVAPYSAAKTVLQDRFAHEPFMNIKLYAACLLCRRIVSEMRASVLSRPVGKSNIYNRRGRHTQR